MIIKSRKKRNTRKRSRLKSEYAKTAATKKKLPFKLLDNFSFCDKVVFKIFIFFDYFKKVKEVMIACIK